MLSGVDKSEYTGLIFWSGQKNLSSMKTMICPAVDVVKRPQLSSASNTLTHFKSQNTCKHRPLCILCRNLADTAAQQRNGSFSFFGRTTEKEELIKVRVSLAEVKEVQVMIGKWKEVEKILTFPA